MVPSCQYDHTSGYRGQRFRCPLLSPEPTGESCDHEQEALDKGCVRYINIELGGLMRVLLDREGETYKTIYRQRTSAERITSQATALGIERPKVRNARSVHNLNTLTYIVINLRARPRAKEINASKRAAA